MNLRRCFVETEALRDFPDADDAFAFLNSWERILHVQENEKHGMRTPQALGLIGRILD